MDVDINTSMRDYYFYDTVATYTLVPEEELLVPNDSPTIHHNNVFYRYTKSSPTTGISGAYPEGGYYGTDPLSGINSDGNYFENYMAGQTIQYSFGDDVGTNNFNLTATSIPSSHSKYYSWIDNSYKNKWAYLTGGGYLLGNSTSKADNFRYHRTSGYVTEFSALVRRPINKHLDDGWFSNPKGVNYNLMTGATGGVMFRKDLTDTSPFIYVGISRENKKPYIVVRYNSTSASSAMETIELNDFCSCKNADFDLSYSWVKIKKTSTGVQVFLALKQESDMTTSPNWELAKTFTNSQFSGNQNWYGGLATLSNVLNQPTAEDKFYWAGSEYDYIAFSSSSAKNGKKVLSIEEEAIMNNINLYPNPATDAFSFTVPTQFKQSILNVSISDISGKVVHSATFQNNTGNDLSVKTNTLSNGLYFVKIDIDDASVTKKLLINK